MVAINYASKEVSCKIVYYGPGLSGKTTNLQYVHEKVPQDTRGKLISLATEADRTLYFDFLPINIGTINGFAAKFQLYTVPGQVYYNATRKLVLRGVDGIVFVADSQPDKMDENIEALSNLEDNLKEYGYDLNDMPMVIQYNKRDLPGVLSVEELNAKINTRNLPTFEASAHIGTGVFGTLKLIIKMVLDKTKNSNVRKRKSIITENKPPVETPTAQPQAAPPVTPQAAPAPEATPPVTPPVQERIPVAPQPAAVQESQAVTAQAAPSVQSAPVATMTPEPVQAAPASRPFPGSATGGIAIEPGNAASTNIQPSETSSSVSNVPNGAEVSMKEGDSDTGQPLMAPSLRKKESSKKRGFFKKLFGLK